jgi:hypothetical protein
MGCYYAFYLMYFVFEFLCFMQRAKEGREPTQSEIFVETRKGNKGKQMDVETVKVIVSQNLTL